MADLRQRKSTPASAPSPAAGKSKTKSPPEEPASLALGAAFIAFSLLVGSALYYYVDNTSNGPFATWVNDKLPLVQQYLPITSGTPLFGANAEPSPANNLRLTEAELSAFDGSNPDKPIYLAISGTIFDVSVSPQFYGPEGMYGHFSGRDATRAWVSECWGEEEQLTWRLDGLEEKFAPTYIDEELERVRAGEPGVAEKLLPSIPQDSVMELAEKALEKLGPVSAAEKKRRAAEDAKEVAEKIQEKIDHWYGFFSNSPKYSVVGKVVLDKNKPAPPPLCELALRKKPIKGGKLDELLASVAKEGAGRDEL